MESEAGSRVPVVSWPARGRPPQAAARRAGLEIVEKVLTRSSPARTRRSGTLACFASRTVASLDRFDHGVRLIISGLKRGHGGDLGPHLGQIEDPGAGSRT